MKTLILPHTLPGTRGLAWTEEMPPGAHQRSTGSYTYESAQQALNIKIVGSWANVRALVKQTIGFAQVFPMFDPANFGTQGPYLLSRTMPARHPRLTGLRCTKIASWQGVGISKTVFPDPTHGAGIVGEGHIGNFEYIYATLIFENPRYAMVSDGDMTVNEVRKSECTRFLEWSFDSNVETLARKGVVWNFCRPGLSQITFVGDRFLRTPKGVLKWTWYGVPESFLLLGKIVPTNYLKRLGTVNATAFPPDAYRNQNLAGNFPVEFPPGTLLLLPPKLDFTAAAHPEFLSGVDVGSLVPRCVNLSGSAVYFNPPSDDTTAVDLTDYGGDGAEPVRGHNLAPLVKPRTGAVAPNGIWYTAHLGAAGDAPANDLALLHQYSNWDALFQAVETL